MSHWTINSETGQKDKSDINGYMIVETATGFQLQDANGNVLDSQPFVVFSYTDGNNINWTVTLNSLGDLPSGAWQNNDPTIDNEEDGGWTAQAGGGPPDPVSASSASAK